MHNLILHDYPSFVPLLLQLLQGVTQVQGVAITSFDMFNADPGLPFANRACSYS